MGKKKHANLSLIPGKPQLMKFVAPVGPLSPEQISAELKKLVPYLQRLGLTNFMVLGYRKPLPEDNEKRKIVGEIPYCFPYFSTSFEAASLVHDFNEMLKQKNEELFLKGQLPVKEKNADIRSRPAPDPKGVEEPKRPEGGLIPGPDPAPGPGTEIAVDKQ